MVADHHSWIDPRWIAAGVLMSAMCITINDAEAAIDAAANALHVPADDVIAYVLKAHSLPLPL